MSTREAEAAKARRRRTLMAETIVTLIFTDGNVREAASELKLSNASALNKRIRSWGLAPMLEVIRKNAARAA